MLAAESEIYEIKEFIDSLNSEKESIVIVEGKRDSAALKKLGFTEKVLEFHRFGGLTKFADSVSDHKNLIILFDSDRKGKYLTRRVIEQLEHRTRIDLSYKKKLAQITRGKIRAIEELDRYEQFLYGVADFSY
jgi:5S rRNA maturation endonuclease (ribonuclease M5)